MKINITNINDDYLGTLPLIGKVSPTVCLGDNVRITRPYCRCCGGSCGIRAGLWKHHRHYNQTWIVPTQKFGKRKSYKRDLKKHHRESIRYPQ